MTGFASREHWLAFSYDEDGQRYVAGCHCGFRADLDVDCGWGDSVVNHIAEVASLEALNHVENQYGGGDNAAMAKEVAYGSHPRPLQRQPGARP